MPQRDLPAAFPGVATAWTGHGAEVAQQRPPHQGDGDPFQGAVPCVCGGTWRYVLAGTEAHPVWYCLHCGFVSNLRPQLRRERSRGHRA